MGMKTLVTSAMVAMLASTAMAQTLDPVRVEMFRSILKGNECVMSETLAANILPRFDFTRDETRAIVGALVAAGEVRLDGSTLNLVDGSCETQDPVVELLGQRDVQQFIAVMAENNCAMTEADGEAVFTARGMTKAQVGAIVGPMIQAGMASFQGGILSVDSAYCSAPVVVQEAPPVVGLPVEMASAPELDRSGMFGMSRVRALVDAMAANSCTLNMETPDAFLGEAGIEHGFATFVARKMIADGYASMVDGQTMQLSAPYCVSANSPAPAAPAETPSNETPAVDMNMVASLREIFLANSCRLTEDQMDALLPPAGFNKDNIKPVFGYLESNGEMGEDGPDLVFYNDACVAAPAEVATAPAETPAVEMDRSGMFGMSRVAALVDVMAQNGCTLNMEVADGYLAEAGIQHSFATFIAKKMLSDGFASMVDGQNMALSAPYCIAAGGAAAQVETPVEAPVVTPVETPVEVVPTPTAPVETPNEVSTQVPAMVENDGTLEGMFIYAAAQNGCALNVEAAGAPLAEAGLRMDQAYRIVDTMVADGRATLGNNGAVVTLNAALCAGGAQPVEQAQQPVEAAEAAIEAAEAAVEAAEAAAAIDAAEAAVEAAEAAVEAVNVPVENRDDPRAGLMAMLAANGCEVTQANVAGLVSAAGLDFNTSMQMLTQMMGSGEATSPDGGQTLQVGAPLCVAAAAAASTPMTPRETFINLIKQNNCSITAAEFSSLLPANGLDASTAFGMISDLEAEGVISLPATRDVVTLSAEMCR